MEILLTILISTEFNVVASPFCKPYCFESEIPYCHPLKVPLPVFEKPLEHVLSGSNMVDFLVVSSSFLAAVVHFLAVSSSFLAVVVDFLAVF